MRNISINEASMAPRRRDSAGVALFSAGFRPFFLLAAVWAAVAIPGWLAAYVHGFLLPGAIPAIVWHAHEMVCGFGAAAVAGFLLTAIPNWTGRLPLRGMPLVALVFLWLAGRIALLVSATIGPFAAAILDLAFPVVLVAAVARELVAGRNWRNLPMAAALALLVASSALVHLQTNDIAYTASLGNRLGIATLLALIGLVGGRIIPSFTRNWLAKRPGARLPAPAGPFDITCLAALAIALIAWVAVPEARITPFLEILGGFAAVLRLVRWRGVATVREPLLLILHTGYAWLAAGLVLLGTNGVFDFVPAGAPLHALTVGAIGTMTLAVMTRASLGHTGRELAASRGTITIYLLVTIAAFLRVAAPLAGINTVLITSLAGLAWTGAFALFAVLYGPILARPRAI